MPYFASQNRRGEVASPNKGGEKNVTKHVNLWFAVLEKTKKHVDLEFEVSENTAKHVDL